MTEEWAEAIASKPFVLIDTLPSRLTDTAAVLLPSATWMEKAGSFQNAADRLQAFERAITPIDYCKSESQMAIDLLAAWEGRASVKFDPEQTRAEISTLSGLSGFRNEIVRPESKVSIESDMVVVDL